MGGDSFNEFSPLGTFPAPPRFALVKITAALFLALLLIVPRPALAEEKKLLVGMELAYPPFEMRDERGEPAGVSVDLARALGEQLGRAVEIQNLPFDGLIPALKTGRIDLIISSMTATPERAQIGRAHV